MLRIPVQDAFESPTMGFLDPDMQSKERALDPVRAVGNPNVTSQYHQLLHGANAAGSSAIVCLTQLGMSSPSSYTSRFRSRGSEDRRTVSARKERKNENES